ncbi:MAG: hypothetical protein J7L15_06255, partial [Clostridiales bacterium]|nr:hypothetical protein [Clostridiales bacterium]
ISSGRQVRYVRNYTKGSSQAAANNHTVEIQAIEYGTGINVGLASNGGVASGSYDTNYTIINDGNTATESYTSCGTALEYIDLDLGSIYEIESIKLWHYWGDGRTFYYNKVQVSLDGIIWRTLFDTQTNDLEYSETSAGKTVYLPKYSIDVSDVTNGSIPEKVCIIDSKLSFEDGTGYQYPVILKDDYDFMPKRLDEVDFFRDGSGIALWKLDRNSVEAGGNYTSISMGSIHWSGGSPMPGQTCLYSNNSGALKTDLIILPQEISVSFWHYAINPSSDSGSKFIFSFRSGSTIIFAFTNHQTYASSRDAYLVYYSGTHKETSAVQPGYGTWQHFTITSTGKVYRNGGLTSLAFTSIPDMSIVNEGMNLHTHANSSSYYACGYTSMFRVFGKEVSSDEVSDLYENEQQEFFRNTRTYYDTRIEGRSIETKIELQNIGDKCTRVEADVWKQATYDNLLTADGDVFITSSGNNFKVER